MKNRLSLFLLVFLLSASSKAQGFFDIDFLDKVTDGFAEVVSSLPDVDFNLDDSLEGVSKYIEEGVLGDTNKKKPADDFLDKAVSGEKSTAYFSDFYTLYDKDNNIKVSVSNADSDYKIKVTVKSTNHKSLRSIYSAADRPIIMLTDDSGNSIKINFSAKKLLAYDNSINLYLEYPRDYLGKYINILFKGHEFYTTEDFIITVPVRNGKILMLD